MARGKYLAILFLLSSDRYRCGELILSIKNDYAKQQRNCPKTLTDMYGEIVVFNHTRAKPVSGGRNKGLNFGNVAIESKTAGDSNHVSGGGIGRKL